MRTQYDKHGKLENIETYVGKIQDFKDDKVSFKNELTMGISHKENSCN
ncbi:hypothetical protein [Flammeovirga kamogawensis]|uniref:Uncharacterized protein n=1 Tax=Flammeovirga kamogawensis TaxID=373891 RepID=A0ABX8H5Y2_9BACT|nr:hypothetical protein [Flammeovirga kamogawensis]MBB6463540.1 hypothetical protein [Flammeovirga kamogawensis]QWG10595.1 hypothetical protein KM029_24750 [Flammeovirga kamogawensis]